MEVLDYLPDEQIISDVTILYSLRSSGLPWRVREKRSGIAMVLIPPGRFSMGASPEDQIADFEERPLHSVLITKPLYVGQTLVTQAEYKLLVNDNPSFNKKGGDYPVERVSWTLANGAAQSLGLRLPTEAEWEYLCRAGCSSIRYGLLDDIGWYYRNSLGSTQPVAKKKSNAFGIYDTIGNLLEWCSDWYLTTSYSSYANGAIDPSGPPHGHLRVLRGGAWDSHPTGLCRASSRYAATPDLAHDTIGFRVVSEAF